MSRVPSRPLLPILLAIVAAVAVPQAAHAHADLLNASPGANSSVVAAPEHLTLTFSETIDPDSAAVQLTDARARPVDGVGPVSIVGGRTAAVVLPELPPGVYTVTYRVLSTIDGHATDGSFAFLVDPTGAAAPPADTARSSSPSVDALTVAARWLALASLLVALGSLVVWASAAEPVLAARPGIDRRPPWALVATSAALAAVGVAGYLVLAARPIADSPGGGLPLDPAAPFGWTPFAIALRLALLAGIAAGVVAVLAARGRWSGRQPPIAAGALLVVSLAGMSVAGHAAAIGGPAFAAVDLIHLVAVAAWLGGLPAAVLLARRAREDRRRTLAEMLTRHGRLAILAAPMVIVTGLANSPLVLGRARDLVASDYGNLLLAKALLVSVALGIGAVNHLALRGRRGSTVAGLLGAELAVGVLAIAAAATMVTIQPASARQDTLIASSVRPAHFFERIDGARIHLAVSLPAPGVQSYRVTVRAEGRGAPSDLEDVALAFTPPPGSDLPAERVLLETDAAASVWTAAGDFTPTPGDWLVDVVVRRDGVPTASVGFELRVVDPGGGELAPPADTGFGVPAPIAAAWSLLPSGFAGWIPTFVAGAAVLALGLLRPSPPRELARGAAAALLVVATLTAGTRALVATANAPSAVDLGAQPALSNGDTEGGRAVYQANCASCHGRDGDGNGALSVLPRPTDLGDAIPDLTDAELSYRIATGMAGTPMPAFAGLLTPGERSDLVAYLRERWGDR